MIKQRRSVSKTRQPQKNVNRHTGDLPLALPGWHAIAVDDTTPDHYHISIAMDLSSPRQCTEMKKCEDDRQPWKFGTTTLHVRDLPMHGRFVDLEIKRPRFQCRKCGAISTADLGPHIHQKHRMTVRLLDYIYRQAAARTFLDISREVGLADVTIGRLLQNRRQITSIDSSVTAPRILGIDDKHINGKWYTVFVDVENKLLLDIYETRKIENLRHFVNRMKPNVDKVEAVCQDMSDTYRSFSQKYFPNAVIVIDKFHVVIKANNAVDRARTDVKKAMTDEQYKEFKYVRKSFLKERDKVKFPKRLEKWLYAYPTFRRVYDARQKFYEFYKNQTRQEAEQFYAEWLNKLETDDTADDDTRRCFKRLLDCMSGDSREHIFNYFDYKYTSGFLEGLNRQIKRVSVTGPRYDYETLRQKLLLAHGPDKVKYQKFWRRGRADAKPIGPKDGRLSAMRELKKLKKRRAQKDSLKILSAHENASTIVAKPTIPTLPLGMRQRELDLFPANDPNIKPPSRR